MGALFYVLIIFVSTLVLFFVEASTRLHVMWILGVILSYPALWMLCRSLGLIILAMCGKKTVGEVIAIRGKGDGILKVRYQDETGNIHEVEERAIYGFLKRTRPSEEVTVRYFQRFPKWISFGWRTVIYWLPIDLFWVAFTVICWIGFTGWGV